MIPSRRVFEDHAGDYDQWFEKHGDIYTAQVRMFHNALPDYGRGLEIGIGSGRFALPLGIRFGIDPSGKLAHMAKNRGIEVVVGEGEHLPYRSGSFDHVLMMTVICFLDDSKTVFIEVNRVLKPKGMLIVGFIEKDGEIQREFLHESTKGRFLRYAKFMSASEVAGIFSDADFAGVSVIERSRGFCILKGIKKGL
jgi:ubiquinone/menaquinone biosynthesis C-methylase UbiE